MTDDEPNEDGELGDFNPEGAVDHDYDDALKEFEDDVEGEVGNKVRQITPPDTAVDLVTRQALFVRKKVANSLDEYFEDEGFNLLTYKGHPYLPVTREDHVYECVFIPGKPGEIHKGDKWKTYDYPEGRLARIPLEQAWLNSGEEQYAWSTDFIAAATVSLLLNLQEQADEDAYRATVDVAYDTFGEEIVDEALNRAPFDEW